MPASPAPELTLLKAFEGALREGLLLDESLGGILDASLRFFDAAAVALLPAGAPPMTRSGRSLIASAAEQRLSQHLADVLEKGRPNKETESGLAFFGAPVKVADTVRAAFGLAIGAGSANSDAEEAVRLFARSIAHVLERDRTLSTLMKRREEAVALFEFASGALHSLNADEVIRLTVASLSRELEFDRVLAYRFHPGTREVEEIVIHGSGEETNPGKVVTGRRPIEQVEILARCLAAHGPVF
ncbi:MAG TPA: hypothetical protein VGR00_01985, partial [Thermoanaerobaculia bacterium]|nr:hypothetical protein [Thermoanaerobaculia bacterium]